MSAGRRRALDAVVHRSLAKDPRDRCRSAAELANDLVPALARCESVDARYSASAPDAPIRGPSTV
jgi:hypothetical protein